MLPKITPRLQGRRKVKGTTDREPRPTYRCSAAGVRESTRTKRVRDRQARLLQRLVGQPPGACSLDIACRLGAKQTRAEFSPTVATQEMQRH